MFFRAIDFLDINVKIAMVRLLLFFSCAFSVSYFVFLELCFFIVVMKAIAWLHAVFFQAFC